VVGGSKQYHGSPAFNALAALRAGVDLATVLAPERAANIIATFSPDLIVYPLEGEYLGRRHLKTMLEFSKKKTAVVIGGGLTRNKETLSAVRIFLKKTTIPCVIDADAIYAIDGKISRKMFLLTPHAGEFYALTGKKVATNINQRKNAVMKEAKRFGIAMLLKGHIDIISDGTKTALNNTGNAYMTKGGTGDVLAGICGSLIAQGNSIFDSACAAAYICGRAGDLAAKEKKQSLLASDLIEKIADVVS